MFGALSRAFTGRAGFLASLLALALIALIAAAVLLKLPQIEQNLQIESEQVVSENMAATDTLRRLSVEGRDLVLEGEFEAPAALAARLSEIEGLHQVMINGELIKPEREANQAEEAEQSLVKSDTQQAPPADEPASDTGAVQEEAAIEISETADVADQAEELEQDQAPQAVVDMVDAENTAATASPIAVVEPRHAEEQPAATEEVDVADDSLAQQASNIARSTQQDAGQAMQGATEESPGTAEEMADQSNLSLRYDGTRLRLTGHLGDDQMAKLIVERVRAVLPRGSELEAEVDGKGAYSRLNWMREFLEVVADLPDDAQGVINGSDQAGVQIVPDPEQTLRKTVPEHQQAPVEAENELPEAQAGAIEPQPEALPERSELVGEPVQAMAEPEAEQVTATAEQANQGEPGTAVDPKSYIVALNRRLASRPVFAAGQFEVTDALRAELDQLAELMQAHPNLLLKVVGNIDFSGDRRVADYVGFRRALEIRDYLYARKIEPYRVYVSRLPGRRAFDKHVQVVFYISE